MMPRLLFFLYGLLLISGCTEIIFEGRPLPQKDAHFQEGDRVAWVGNSITHGGQYHSFVYLYYLTRFPDRKFEIFNCGISGNVTSQVLDRFAKDIRPHQPTVATVMLGMNDVGRHLYGNNRNYPASQREQKRRFETYKQDMGALIDSLESTGARLVLFTPSIYDQTVVFEKDTTETEEEELFTANDGLAIYADYIRQQAKVLRYPVVDFFDVMGSINLSMQAAEPSFTIVGKDRVHPGKSGHFVMAYSFLKTQEVPALVSAIYIDVASDSLYAENGRLQANTWNLDDTKLEFDFRANALPFPMDTSMAYPDLVPFVSEMNREILQIAGLKKGTYGLLIDGEQVGKYGQEELTVGVNLATNRNTPQFRQALEVDSLNRARHNLASFRLRLLAHMEYGWLKDLPRPIDLEEAEKVLDEKVEKVKDKPWYGYLKDQAEKYLDEKPREAETREELAKLVDQLYEVNQPKLHHYQLRKLD